MEAAKKQNKAIARQKRQQAAATSKGKKFNKRLWQGTVLYPQPADETDDPKVLEKVVGKAERKRRRAEKKEKKAHKEEELKKEVRAELVQSGWRRPPAEWKRPPQGYYGMICYHIT